MPRLSVLLVAVALVLGVGACGGDDSDDPPAPASAVETKSEHAEAAARNAEVLEEYRGRQQAGAPTADEREIEKETETLYEILGGDTAQAPNRIEVASESFCDLMSSEAQKQTIEYASRSSGVVKEWSCREAVQLLLLRSRRSGGFRQTEGTEVIGVNARGDRATATIRFGNRAATSVALVKEEGEWKLAASPVTGE